MSEVFSHHKPEILAPAGNPESIPAAVRCGADAVYAGGERFSARAGAVNFSDAELVKAVEYCHLHGVKFYRAMNTIVFADEMEDFLKAARFTAEAGADGIIVQDIGAARLLKEMLPDMKLNASTQMTIHTPEGAKLAAEMGFSRVVAARELSIEQISEMVQTGIEIEVFIHGALCMSVSGQCYMSAFIGSRSADRGMCAQACRLPFSAIEQGERCGSGEHGEHGRQAEYGEHGRQTGHGEQTERYDLSLKDLCGIPHIQKLAEIGVASFKIEGRMKRAEYTAAAAAACRAALDGKAYDLDTLKAVFSRSGFTDGYLTGKTGGEMFGFRRKEDVVSAEAVLPKIRESYRKETKAAGAEADFFVKIKRGEPVTLKMTCGGNSVSAAGAVPETAKNRSADSEYVRRQVDKLGDTVYTLGNISAEIDDGLMISASAINSLRREAVEKMDSMRIKEAKPAYEVREVKLGYERKKHSPKKIRVRISSPEQLGAVPESVEDIIVPMDMGIGAGGGISPEKRFIIAPPRFIGNEDAVKKKLSEVRNMGFKRLLCTGPAYIRIGRELGFEMHGDFGLNIANPYAAETAAKLGLSDITASFEAKLSQIAAMCGDCGNSVPVGVLVYGRIPVMLTKNCPIKQANGGCKDCKGELLDRTGRRFSVKCRNPMDSGYCEIFNSDVLMMTDRISEISADFVILNFTDESPEETARIIKCCMDGKKALDSGFTRGLYYRGVV